MYHKCNTHILEVYSGTSFVVKNFLFMYLIQG